MTRITQEDIPSLALWAILFIIISYYWHRFVFKGGAERWAGKNFLFRGTIIPPMSAKRLKILVTIPYLFFIGFTIALFL